MEDETGERIKQARVARGISQAVLAASVGVSNSYLSHIEAGRRPVSDSIRDQIAAALGIDPKQLEEGVPADRKEELRLNLGFAEMALRNGNQELARSSFEEALESAQTMPLARYVDEAQWGLARAIEATGRLEDAIAAYEKLLSKPALSPEVSRAAVRVALVRASRECGDLGRAIDVGEGGLTDLQSAPPEELASYVELISTLAGCYVERGDLIRASLLTRRALELADQAGSLPARAAAAWEAASVAGTRHDTVAARHYADRALALYQELDSQRAVAMLRVVHAKILLTQDQPEPGEAMTLLDRAFDELSEAGNDVDLAYVRAEQARARLISGEPSVAAELLTAALGAMAEGDKLQRGRLLLLQGHVLRADGKTEDALASFQDAANHLRLAGAVRQAASAWRELGEAYVELGRAEDAIAAMRQATDLVGVKPAPHAVTSRVTS